MRHQAAVDDAQAGAVSKLIESLNGTHNSVVQVGSILLLKVDGAPLALRTVTQREPIFVERNPGLLKQPADLLAVLQRTCEEEEGPPDLTGK